MTSDRVALVLASSTGGIGRHVAMLAGGLTEDGVAVTVCGPAAAEAQFGFTAAGAAFHPVEIPANPRVGDAVAVRALRALLRGDGGGYAAVHAHGLRAGLVAALARPAECPFVVTWHNLVLAAGLRGRLYHRIERYVARAADVTLGVSTDLVARAEALGARDARLAAVPAPPLPPATRDPAATRRDLGAVPGQPVILAAGRLHPQKGHEVLIAAAARWRDRRPRPLVVIAGNGPARADLARRIAESRAPVTLLGHRTDISDLLAAATVVVATSVWEGQPLFVQEALRSGTPLVATAVGGVPDVVGEAATLVPAGDVDAVDTAVACLLDDAQLRSEYAARGPRRAAAWPSQRDAVAEVRAVYAEIARAGSVAERR